MNTGLNEQLTVDGKAKGLCRDYQRKIGASRSIEDLVKLFIKGIDFCVNNDYPTLDFMRAHFKGKSEPFGGFVDDDLPELKNMPDVVLNGHCRAFLEYDGYQVARVVARHTSEAAVNVSERAIVTIDAFDTVKLTVAVAGRDAKVYVNKYGDAQVVCIGQGIQVTTHNKNTY